VRLGGGWYCSASSPVTVFGMITVESLGSIIEERVSWQKQQQRYKDNISTNFNIQ
jgi:hypothetical protein